MKILDSVMRQVKYKTPKVTDKAKDTVQGGADLLGKGIDKAPGINKLVPAAGEKAKDAFDLASYKAAQGGLWIAQKAAQIKEKLGK